MGVIHRQSDTTSHQTELDLEINSALSIRRRKLLTDAASLGATTVYGPSYRRRYGPRAGALDTDGRPMIGGSGRVLDWATTPIPGLYWAGNCIVSPTRAGYFCGNGTIFLALTLEYLARVVVATGIHDGVK